MCSQLSLLSSQILAVQSSYQPSMVLLFFLWDMAASIGEALPLWLAKPPGENSLTVWRATSCVVGSSGSRGSAGLLRTATQIPLLDNFITVESFRAKDVSASLNSGASDSLFRPKTFLLICVSHLYLAYLSGTKPLLSSYYSLFNESVVVCNLHLKFEASADLFRWISSDSCSLLLLQQTVHVLQTEFAPAGRAFCWACSPLPARGNGTTFRFSQKKWGAESSWTIVQKFLAVRKENSGEPDSYKRSALTFLLLNSSLEDQIRGRGKLMSCLCCTRREV